MKQKNGGNTRGKYAIGESNGAHSLLLLLLLLLLMFSFLCCFCGDYLNNISTPKFLSQNYCANLYSTKIYILENID